MRDIDFDELDRAVSSVLGKTSLATDTAEGAPVETTHLITPAADAATAGPDNTAQVDLAPRKDLVQKRRTGRFMDVVPPTSRPKSHVAQQPAVSRQAPSIAPVSETPAQEPEPAEVPSVVSTAPEAEQHNVHAQAHETDDLTDERDKASDALDEAAGELAGLNGLMHGSNDMVPLDTPLKHDMTLEKRPLGAFSLGDTDGALLTDSAKRHQDGVVESDAAPANAFDMEMSHALRKELDAHDDTTSKLEDAVEPVVEKASKPTLEATEDDISEELQDKMLDIASQPIEPEAKEAPKVHSQPIGGGSIPQQYKAQSTPQSEDITPVFETESYHQPLLHTKKKKSGWLSVLFIIILVALGIGLGAVVYFLDPFGLL